VAHHAAGANRVQLLQEHEPRRRELVENHPMSEEPAGSAGAVAVTCMLAVGIFKLQAGGQHTRPSQKEMPFALHFAREQASIGAGPRPERMSPWRPCLHHARCGAFSWF
jgi:hypothetical protein